MRIITRLDEMMSMRKISLKELSKRINITETNLSKIKNGKSKAVFFDTLMLLCNELDCQPGDLLECEGIDKKAPVFRKFVGLKTWNKKS